MRSIDRPSTTCCFKSALSRGSPQLGKKARVDLLDGVRDPVRAGTRDPQVARANVRECRRRLGRHALRHVGNEHFGWHDDRWPLGAAFFHEHRELHLDVAWLLA